MPLFSLIISYRNRDTQRVRRCLQSLAAQVFADFEVLFVDYGSDLAVSTEVRMIAGGFSFCKYIYNDTRGMVWNRSHALNTGIREVTGDYIVTTDVDLIFHPRFLQRLSAKADPGKLINAKAYYLPQDFTRYEELFATAAAGSRWSVSDACALGLFQMVSRERMQEANGFDEYYRIWGVEDLDLQRKLLGQQLKAEWLDIQDFPLYHQWHPSSNAILPAGWYQLMKGYYDDNHEQPRGCMGKVYREEERPALRAALGSAYDELVEVKIEYPKEYGVAKLYQVLAELAPGRGFYVSCTNSYLSPGSPKGRLTEAVSTINKLLTKTEISYRLTDIKIYETKYASIEELRNILFYLLLAMRPYIADYYLRYDASHFLCVVVKK